MIMAASLFVYVPFILKIIITWTITPYVVCIVFVWFSQVCFGSLFMDLSSQHKSHVEYST